MFKVASNYSTYWKGEGFSESVSSLQDPELAKSLYNKPSLDFEEENVLLGMLPRKYVFIKHILNSSREHFNPEVYSLFFKFVLRCVYYDLDYLEKIEDDTSYNGKYFLPILKSLQGKYSFEVGVDKLPARTSSETFFYFACLLGFVKSLGKKDTISLCYSDGFLITLLDSTSPADYPYVHVYSLYILSQHFDTVRGQGNCGKVRLQNREWTWFAWNM